MTIITFVYRLTGFLIGGFAHFGGFIGAFSIVLDLALLHFDFLADFSADRFAPFFGDVFTAFHRFAFFHRFVITVLLDVAIMRRWIVT